MFNSILKVSYCLLFLSVLLFSTSGCETASSFSSGDINMQDVARMVKSGGGAPKRKESRAQGENSFAEHMQKTDNWLQKNLW